MGQAKQRGSFEQRKAESLAREAESFRDRVECIAHRARVRRAATQRRNIEAGNARRAAHIIGSGMTQRPRRLGRSIMVGALTGLAAIAGPMR